MYTEVNLTCQDAKIENILAQVLHCRGLCRRQSHDGEKSSVVRGFNGCNLSLQVIEGVFSRVVSIVFKSHCQCTGTAGYLSKIIFRCNRIGV